MNSDTARKKKKAEGQRTHCDTYIELGKIVYRSRLQRAGDRPRNNVCAQSACAAASCQYYKSGRMVRYHHTYMNAENYLA